MEDIDPGSTPTRRVHAACLPGQKSVAELLMQLDANERPGITGADFSALFRRCGCGLVTTRRAFDDHKCVIDLTGDD